MIRGLYGEKAMEDCRGCRLGLAPVGPHIYSVAEAAFAALRLPAKSSKRQVIVVSGESGAGKTEANKQLMEFLVWRGGTSSAAGLTEKILDANPILEAFGNAKTVRNNNSSRFGRYVLLLMDGQRAAVRGACTKVYLLETSRVTSATARNERSFHVFYQLLAGRRAPAQQPGTSTPGNPRSAPTAAEFRYLNGTGTTTIIGVDDAAAHAEVEHARTHWPACGRGERIVGVAARLASIGQPSIRAKVERRGGGGSALRHSRRDPPSNRGGIRLLGQDAHSTSDAEDHCARRDDDNRTYAGEGGRITRCARQGGL